MIAEPLNHDRHLRTLWIFLGRKQRTPTCVLARVLGQEGQTHEENIFLTTSGMYPASRRSRLHLPHYRRSVRPRGRRLRHHLPSATAGRGRRKKEPTGHPPSHGEQAVDEAERESEKGKSVNHAPSRQQTPEAAARSGQEERDHREPA